MSCRAAISLCSFKMLLFLASLLSRASADSWTCSGLTELDLSLGPVWVPFKSDKAEPYSSTNKNCIWKLSIPNGMYASVNVKASFAKDDKFTLFNTLGYKHSFGDIGGDLPSTLNDTFYLPADENGSFIELNSTGNDPGFLTFETQLFNIPNLPIQPMTVSSHGNLPFIPLANFSTTQFLFGCTTEYIFRVATDGYSYKYDSCFMYQGDSPQGTFLSGLSKQIDGVPMRFLNRITVICLGIDFPDAILLVAPVSALLGENAPWSIRTAQNFRFSLETLHTEKNQSAFLTTYCPDYCLEYLEDVSFVDSQNGTLSLYEGCPVFGSIGFGFQLLESFSLRDNLSYLPQRMAGLWKTYVSTNGDSVVTIDRKNEKYKTISSSRKGFFPSNKFGGAKDVDNSGVTKFTASSGSYAFYCKIEEFADAAVQVTIDQGGGRNYTKIIKATNCKQDTVLSTGVEGQSMTIEITPVGPIAGYVLLSYEFIQTSSAGVTGLFSIMVCFWRFQ